MREREKGTGGYVVNNSASAAQQHQRRQTDSIMGSLRTLSCPRRMLVAGLIRESGVGAASGTQRFFVSSLVSWLISLPLPLSALSLFSSGLSRHIFSGSVLPFLPSSLAPGSASSPLLLSVCLSAF